MEGALSPEGSWGERKVDGCRDLGGPIPPRVDFEIQVGASGLVNANRKD